MRRYTLSRLRRIIRAPVELRVMVSDTVREWNRSIGRASTGHLHVRLLVLSGMGAISAFVAGMTGSVVAAGWAFFCSGSSTFIALALTRRVERPQSNVL
jgi:hypothetical protein